MKIPSLRFPPGRLIAGFFLLIAGVSLSFAQAGAGITEPMPPDASPRGDGMGAELREDGLSDDGRRFFTKTAALGEKEVLLSRIAAERAIAPRVRSFAAEMVRAHTAANEELAALARRKGARPEAKTPEATREIEQAWREKEADDFDEDYLEAIIECHQDTVEVLEKGAEADDAEIVAYSNRMLPVVKSHLERARMLEEATD